MQITFNLPTEPWKSSDPNPSLTAALCLTWMGRRLDGLSNLSSCTRRTLLTSVTETVAKLGGGWHLAYMISVRSCWGRGLRHWTAGYMRSCLPYGSLVQLLRSERRGWSSKSGKGKETAKIATNTAVLHCSVCLTRCLSICHLIDLEIWQLYALEIAWEWTIIIPYMITILLLLIYILF